MEEEAGHINPFLACLRNHSLYQAINFPTRYRDGQTLTILDLVRDPGTIVSIKPETSFGVSDPIEIACQLRLFSKKNQYVRHVYTDYNQVRREL